MDGIDAGPGPHGNANPMFLGHYKRGCRCAECVAASRLYGRLDRLKRLNDESYRRRRKEEKRRDAAKIAAASKERAPGSPHLRATLSVGNAGYVSGCRCDGCVAGRNEYKRVRAAKRMADPAFAAECKSKKRAGYERAKSAPGFKEKATLQFRKKLRRVRDTINPLKTSQGCADCGYNLHATALDFDHVRGDKEFGIAKASTSASVDRLVAETSKCEVVCANCHRIRTESRRPASRPLATAAELPVGDKKFRHREYQRIRTAVQKNRLADIKRAAGCADCGYRASSVALEFDHVRGEKVGNVSALYAAKASSINDEVAKCEVVCANCHRIRTWERRTGESITRG